MEDAAFLEKRPARFLGACYATRRHREQSEATETSVSNPGLVWVASLSLAMTVATRGKTA
jgi:hypothetical protein